MSKNVFAGIGISYNDNAAQAGKEAVEMAIKNSGNTPDFGVVYVAGKKYRENEKNIKILVENVHKTFITSNPSVEWIGCTTAGILSNYGHTENCVVAMTVKSEFIHTSVGIGDNVSKNPIKAGETAINAALSKLEVDEYLNSYVRYLAIKKKTPKELIKTYPYAVIVLFPGAVQGYPGFESDVLNGITKVVGGHIPIVGGSAGDDFDFTQTYQFANGVVYKNAVVLLAQTYDVLTDIGVAHGFVPTDKNVVVTNAKGKLVSAFNNKSAIKTYSELVNVPIEQILGVKAAWVGVEYPFGMRDLVGDYWVKSPQAGIDDSLMFFANIPKDAIMTLMKPDIKLTVTAGGKATETKDKKKLPVATFVFDCGGRKTCLKKDTKKECDEIIKSVKNTPFIGFYTYGEVGFSYATPPNFVNGTIVAFKITDKLVME